MQIIKFAELQAGSFSINKEQFNSFTAITLNLYPSKPTSAVGETFKVSKITEISRAETPSGQIIGV